MLNWLRIGSLSEKERLIIEEKIPFCWCAKHAFLSVSLLLSSSAAIKCSIPSSSLRMLYHFKSSKSLYTTLSGLEIKEFLPLRTHAILCRCYRSISLKCVDSDTLRRDFRFSDISVSSIPDDSLYSFELFLSEECCIQVYEFMRF